MAKLLISFIQRADLQGNADSHHPPNQRNSEPYRVAFNEKVLSDIIQNLAGITKVIPILSLGNSQCGRASTLEAFLGERNEGIFSSEGKEPGVYVWMRPVPLQGVSLLLLKMWGVNFVNEEDKELDLITKKVLVALMSISSVCLFCGELSTMFQSLTVIYELYRPIKECFYLEASRFLVFVEREARLASSSMLRQREIFNSKGFENPPVIVFRGIPGIRPECREKLLQIVGNLQNHQGFLYSHRKVMDAIQTPDMISALAIILTTILNISRMNLNLRKFIEKIPHFTSPNYRTERRIVEEMNKMSKSILSGTALEFFDEITIASRSYQICESVLSTLQKQYDKNRPIIVMVIIGNQSMGKSTLLNHIVKYLLGCSKLPELFKTGNTGNHTTKASQVLSNPLRLCENQLMLVDLEGIGGTETTYGRLKILQDNLISAILAIASVPCILVRNELSSMEFVERITMKLSKLKSYFNYKMERVHLLVQDRDISADMNNDFELLIQKINREQFEGQEVLKMGNKPNFKCESKTEMCEEFLKKLMADSNFPKRKQSGSPVLLKDLLVEMRYITECSSIEVSEIRLTDQETQECNWFLSWKSPLLRRIFEKLSGNETSGSYESNFNEQYCQFMKECFTKMKELNVNWILQATTTLEDQAASYRAEIVKIECCYQSIKDLSANELLEKLEEQLDFLHQQSKWIGFFTENAAQLKNKLLKVNEKYLSSVRKTDEILLKFEDKRNVLENLLQFQTLTLRSFAPAGLATCDTVSDVITGGTSKSTRLAYGTVSTTLAFNKPAIELFNFEYQSIFMSSAILNPDVIRILEERNQPPVTVLLVIAAKELGVSFLLNEFIRCVAPFTPSSFGAFNGSKLTQILHFNYNGRRACIIHLRIKKNKTKEKYKIIESIAISLIPKVSLTCLFLDSNRKYADDIITKAFSIESESYYQRFNPRVAAIYPGNREEWAFVAKLSELEKRGVHNVRIRVRDFSDNSLKCAVPDVKNEFDISTPLESQELLEALRDVRRPPFARMNINRFRR